MKKEVFNVDELKVFCYSTILLCFLRDFSRHQIGCFFGKGPNGLGQPIPCFGICINLPKFAMIFGIGNDPPPPDIFSKI